MGSMANEKPERRAADAARVPDGDFDAYPEIATTPQWRERVREARAREGLNQGQLAAKLGTTQPTISDLETGKIAQSRLVTPISLELKVPLPYAPALDELERRWIEAGQLLRARHGALYLQQLQHVESLVALLSEAVGSGDRGH